MTTNDNNIQHAANCAYEALLWMAETNEHKTIVKKLFKEASQDGDKAALKTMCAGILDGILYGNWPWVTYNAR